MTRYKCRFCARWITNRLMPAAELRYLPSKPASPPHAALLYNAARYVPEGWLKRKPRVFKLCPDCVHQAIEMLDRT